MRKACLSRETKETSVSLCLELDPTEKKCSVSTGVGFMDHMLELFAHHSGFSFTIEASGDTNVDAHHTVEDIGILLGQAIKEALGDKKGVERYSTKIIPMDESLALVALDLSGRACLSWDVPFSAAFIGEFDTELFKEFFAALVSNAFITLNVRMLSAGNNHHMIEAVFKAFARAMKEAASITSDEVPSSKGLL